MIGIGGNLHDTSFTLIELGAAIFGLAILSRLASRWNISAIPLYLLAGLAFGNGGLAPMNLSKSFIEFGAEIGLLLLMFMLGLEYSGEQLKQNLQRNYASGLLDFLLNFTPGFVAGILLKWSFLGAALLGGVTFISSSGIIAKVLGDLQRLTNPETKTVLSILVLEDLAMAVYLPLMAVAMVGGSMNSMVASVSIAVLAIATVLILSIKFGAKISALISHNSEEITLLTTFGVVLFVAGLAQRLQVSAAIGAFLVGIAMSGRVAEQSHKLFGPLRALFAALFFFFFGLQVDPRRLPPVMVVAVALGLVTAVTKLLTGYLAAKDCGNDKKARLRAGLALIPRGEFSIVIAGLGLAIEPQLGSLAAAYVLLLAVVGPLVMKLAQ
jgi:monovalent cation:H+ antiporter-2, CPA2 family